MKRRGQVSLNLYFFSAEVHSFVFVVFFFMFFFLMISVWDVRAENAVEHSRLHDNAASGNNK